MPARNPRQRLQDILDAIADIERFTAGKSFDQYCADAMLQRAVERLVEAISEASRHVSQSLKNQHPAVPWRQIADIGNIFRHAYDQINDRRVWSTVNDDIAPLKRAVESMVAGIDKSKSP